MSTKKKPLRICVACRTKKSKFELVRVVKTPNDEVMLEGNKRVNGRGAYLCKTSECIGKARKEKSLDRALNAKIPEEIYERLMALIN